MTTQKRTETHAAYALNTTESPTSKWIQKPKTESHFCQPIWARWDKYKQESWAIAKMTAWCPDDGCPENFRESLSIRPRLLFPGVCSDQPCECAYKILKFVALHVPEIIGVFQKNWAVPGYAHALFSPKFLMGGLCVNISAKLEVHTFTRFWDNSDWSFGWGCEPPILGRGGSRGQGWYRSKQRWWVPVGPPQ